MIKVGVRCYENMMAVLSRESVLSEECMVRFGELTRQSGRCKHNEGMEYE